MRKLFRLFKSNHQGSTLVTIIICLAFISILGAMMLSVTMTNLQMKMIESKSKENFYSCETVMEKIRVAAQEIASEAVKYIYTTDVLENYASYLAMEEDARNTAIQRKVVLEFLKEIGKTSSYANDDDILASSGIAIKDLYFLNKLYLEADENDAVSWPSVVCENLGDTFLIRMKDITITYVEGDYRTAISSDIVITMPEFSFTKGTEEVHYRMVQPYQNYVLIADTAITSDNMTGTTSLQGNVYAGTGGITVNGRNSGGYQVNIDGTSVVTRGNITVSDTARLNIGTTTSPMIWAKNLITYTSQDYPATSSLTTDLIVNGISVIKDDLSLEGQNSNVKFLSGAYIGYTGIHSAEGSSMLINGYGSSLDLSGLSELILAGRAHVSVQDITLNKDADILTGESIAFKSNQRAYLLPSIFITNVLHNPVTEGDYADPLIGTPVVTIDDTTETIKYNDYVAATPYKIAAKQTGLETLRYYYLNFDSGKSADQYMKEFFTLYPDTLNKMEPFHLGTVILPVAGTTSIVGNSMSYNASGNLLLTEGMSALAAYNDGDVDNVDDDVTLDTAIAALILNKPIYASTMLEDKTVSLLEGMYSRISHLLTPDSTKAYNETDGAAKASMKTGGVDYIIDSNVNLSSTTTFTEINRFRGDVIFTNMDPNEMNFWVIDGNVTINPNTQFHGFLIATGNITIGDGANLKGLIISTGENGNGTVTVGNTVTLNGRIVTTGTITVGYNCTLSVDAAAESYIADIFTTEGSLLNNIFKNAEMTVDFVIDVPASNTVDLLNMISYENWRRIE